MNCTAQTTQESSPLLEEIEQYCTPEMAFSSSLTGPWTTFEFAYKGTSCNNPSLWITNNGTAFLYCKVQTAQRPWRHMVVYVAPSWRGPYEFRAETNVYGEDAFVFQDKRGNFHMLLHSMHPSKGKTPQKKHNYNKYYNYYCYYSSVDVCDPFYYNPQCALERGVATEWIGSPMAMQASPTPPLASPFRTPSRSPTAHRSRLVVANATNFCLTQMDVPLLFPTGLNQAMIDHGPVFNKFPTNVRER